VDLRASYFNVSATAVEATYVFPVPELAAVSSLQIRSGATVIDGWLSERAKARDAYADALAQRDKAAILEQEREDVVTMRVGTIAPGERVEVRLTLHMRLSYTDGQIFFRFPLVVAPRHVPGVPLPGDRVGAGTAADTNLVPDGSRVSPPLQSGTNVALSVSINLASNAYAIDEIGCTLRTQIVDSSAGTSIRIEALPGQHPDRDLVVRIRTTAHRQPSLSLMTSLDGDGQEGTFALTILPPTIDPSRSAGRDLVVLVDASASMSGWRLPAARRVAARIIDTLTPHDRFTVLTFADTVTRPQWAAAGLIEGTDRNRFRAIEHLFATPAGGNPRLHTALKAAAQLLTNTNRRSILLVITAGQVGNDDQIATFRPRIGGVRIHTLGIGATVNAGLLRQLADVGRGQMLLADTEDALDNLTPTLRRQLGPPLLTNLSLAADGMQLLTNTISPGRPPDVFSGSSVVITGRFRGHPNGSIVVSGAGMDGRPWVSRVTACPVDGPALTQLWARAFLADLQQQYLRCPVDQAAGLERLIITTSLRFGVLTRLTAFVAVSNAPTRSSAAPRQVIQAVELPADWSEPESTLSPYGIEYARILASVRSPAAGPAAPRTTAEPKAVQPNVIRTAPPASAPASAPPPFGAAPPPASAPIPHGPERPRPSRGRYVGAGVGAAAVAVTATVIGVAIGIQNGSMSSAPPATMTQSATASSTTRTMMTSTPASPSTRSATAVDPDTGARLTVTAAPQGRGSDIQVQVSGIPVGTAVRLVVVGRDGARHEIDEWVTGGTSSTRQVTTTVATNEIASVAIEDKSGRIYVTAGLM
ncbi:MAG TPA: VIT and VWA domain-containing protein, partial [Mycobacterium sp.]|nr:VIT and VWA domain-containing protein [Mycobacterium sp.]